MRHRRVPVRQRDTAGAAAVPIPPPSTKSNRDQTRGRQQGRDRITKSGSGSHELNSAHCALSVRAYWDIRNRSGRHRVPPC